MSLQEQMIRQRDFSGGVIHPDALRRDDLDLLPICLRDGENVVTTNTGALIARPGRRFLFEDDGVIVEFKPFDDTPYRLVFVAGRVKVRGEDNSLVASLAATWTAADLESLVVETMDNEVFVAWRGQPRVIKVEPNSLAWSITNYVFETSPEGTIRTPFYRFSSTANIKMRPSAREGNITVDFDTAVLKSTHVGTIFRYAGRQVRITSVINSRKANAQCLEELPTSWTLKVRSTSGFSVGQIVSTDTSDFKGEIIDLDPVADTIRVLGTGKNVTPVTGEQLISLTASVEIDEKDAYNPTSYTIQWDEQFMSNARGWPKSVSKDRQRLIFTNFAQYKNAILWSATGANRDCLIGPDPNDAMLEFVPAECQVYHVVGGFDEFIIADKGAWYVPISVGTPLQPGSVEFRPIFSNELANVRPIEVTEGVIFVDKSMTGIYAIAATGQTARPYIANELNRYHRQLFNGVKSLAATSGTANFPTRQIYAVNLDGSVAIGQFSPERENVGWFPLSGAGKVRSVSGSYGAVLFMTSYTFNGSPVGVAEVVDYDLLLDCAKTLGTADQTDFLELSNGKALTLQNGSSLALSASVAGFFAGRTVSVYADGFYLGETAVPSSGVIAGYSAYEQITVGVRFDWFFEPLFTRFEGGQAAGQGENRRKISNMQITVRGTQEFQVGNRIFGSYRGGEDMSLPVAERDQTYGYREVGRSYDPRVPFKSTFPGSFKLIELATRITV